MSVLSAYCVFILLHCVSLCSVVFLYSLSATFCLPVLTSGPFFFFFSVRLCFSTCIWGVVLILLRCGPHVVSRLCPCFFLYWGFVLIFYFEASSSYYIEASSSYFILRLRARILFWGFVLILYWSFVLIFYFEASASYFILRLCPHILYWGFVLIFYIEALSSFFILRLCPHILFWGFVLIAELHARVGGGP